MTATSKTLAEAWATFAQMTGVVNTSAVQQREMRRAYYAGAISLLDMVLRNLDGTTDDVTEMDFEFMNKLNQELQQYAAAIASGLA